VASSSASHSRFCFFLLLRCSRKRIQVIRNITNTTRYFLNVSYNGPEWPDDEYPFEGTVPLPPDEMMATAGLENVPGETTGGYDVFNIRT
jgi:hypothetical protein